MNAIERLREALTSTFYMRDTDAELDDLAAVDALYQAAKRIADIEERPTYVGWFRDHKAAAEALAAAVRRVEGEA